MGSKGSDSIENRFFNFILEMSVRSLEKLWKYKGINIALFPIKSDPIGFLNGIILGYLLIGNCLVLEIWLNNKNRMNREIHIRFCERLAVEVLLIYSTPIIFS